LEPVLSATLLDYHYNKHHKLYVTKYNEKLEQVEEALAKNNTTKLATLAKDIRFFGGGNYNHTFFWESLAPLKEGGGVRPDESKSELNRLIKNSWGSLDNFITQFNAETAGIQGSGWGWLVYNKRTQSLEYRATANQDLITDLQADIIPLLTIDIWEHAFYIDYKNNKADFLKDIWKVVNWNKIESRLAEARK
jgi:Fe-Mn family superoxide dismutase